MNLRFRPLVLFLASGIWLAFPMLAEGDAPLEISTRFGPLVEIESFFDEDVGSEGAPFKDRC